MPILAPVYSFGYIDNWLTWASPRAGTSPEKFPSGEECRWQAPIDHFVSFDARWVEPVADGTLGPTDNSWNGVGGLLELLGFLRMKMPYELQPAPLREPGLVYSVI